MACYPHCSAPVLVCGGVLRHTQCISTTATGKVRETPTPLLRDAQSRPHLGEATDAALHLGDHAACNDAVVGEFTALPDVEGGKLGCHIILVLEHARDICHEDQLLCLQGRRDLQPAQSMQCHGASWHHTRERALEPLLL
jgi:hypothetical protein